MKRRDFIILSGIAGGGLALGFNTEHQPDLREWMAGPFNTFEPPTAASLGEYVQITSTGEVFVRIVKNEMGQGISTGHAAILNEELEADWEKIHIQYTDMIPGTSHMTGGSGSTFRHWQTMRKAGATARQMLLQAAANQWDMPVKDCRARNGIITNRHNRRKLAYHQVAEAAAGLPIPREVPLKETRDFRSIGKPFKNKVASDIIQGIHPYSMDVDVPGMKYAVIARCPVFGGTLKSFDATEALNAPGVEQVFSVKGAILHPNVHMRDGVVIIASSTWAAIKGRERLKIDWDLGKNQQFDFDKFRKSSLEKVGNDEGRERYALGSPTALQEAAKQFTKTYEFPYQHHALMEPLNCTAHHKPNGEIELWAGTQAADFVTENVLKEYPADKIKFHIHPSGGGFGRRFWAEFPLEAVKASEGAGNIPVKLVWTREDEMQFDYIHPYQIDQYTAGIKKDGTVSSWLSKCGVGNWGGGANWMPYEIPNIHIYHVGLDAFTQTSAWRSVLANGTAFSQECFVDELAEELGKDPYALRMQWLQNDREVNMPGPNPIKTKRTRQCLELVAQKAQWGKSMPPKQGQGIAAYPYLWGNGHGAAVAEVTVEGNKVTIDRLVIGLESGIIVNPKLVEAQAQGNAIWAISALFYGGTEQKGGVIQRTNFHNNPILRISEIPEIEVHTVETEENQPWGVGEIAGPPVYAAICNAIYAASGRRVRRLPLSEEGFET